MDDFHFLACPLFVDGIQCMKFFSHKAANVWHYAKCDGEFPECDYCYILKLVVQDVTRKVYGVIAFDDAAKQFMGISSKDLCLLSTESTSIVEIAHKICNKQFLLTLSVRTNTLCGIAHVKVVIVMVENI